MDAFELTIDELRARRGTKWSKYPPNVLPAWVADMDFKVAEPIQAAISRLVAHQDYGYAYRSGPASLAETFADRMAERHNWRADSERVLVVSELIQGMFTSLLAYSEPGDSAVVQTPLYPPFLMAIEQMGRRRIDNPSLAAGHALRRDTALEISRHRFHKFGLFAIKFDDARSPLNITQGLIERSLADAARARFLAELREPGGEIHLRLRAGDEQA